MRIVQGLAALAARQLIEGAAAAVGAGKGGEVVVGFLTERFTDHSGKLTRALEIANERAWTALEIALAGDSFWDRCKVALSRGEDKAFREQVRAFLDASPLASAAPELRARCLQELRSARKKNVLASGLDPAKLVKEAGAFARFAEPQAMLDAEWAAIGRMARELGDAGFPNLGQLLEARPPQGLPLLVGK